MELTFRSDVLADPVPASIIATTEVNRHAPTFRIVAIEFSEPMNTSTLTANTIRLIGPGGIAVLPRPREE